MRRPVINLLTRLIYSKKYDEKIRKLLLKIRIKICFESEGLGLLLEFSPLEVGNLIKCKFRIIPLRISFPLRCQKEGRLHRVRTN